jgi:predicted GTPase
VALSVPEVDQLSSGIGGLTRDLDDATHDPPSGRPDACDASHGEGIDVLLAEERRLVREVVDDLDSTLERHRRTVQQFTIVLFGRTGTGKSSLIEALTRGDGQSISPAESDWTREIRPVTWGSCFLYDTPGTGGWADGLPRKRETLEAQAHEAVLDADLVLLCFNTQHQLEGEFRQIAEWVIRYGKPTVAVLNHLNREWRDPTRVPRQRRARCSRVVAEHVDHIREELAQCGLGDVPLVALHTMRAVFARATDPYQGPQRKARAQQLRGHGEERLLDWSNLSVLETLVRTAIETDAVGLRLGMLFRHVAGALDLAHQRLEGLEREVRSLWETADNVVARLLGLLGRPDDERLVRDLTRLEEARGAAFEAPETGSVRTHARHVVGAACGVLRAEAIERAENLVDLALGNQQDVDPEEFTAKVYDDTATENAARQATEKISAFLEQRVGLVLDDVRSAMLHETYQHASVSGSAGSGRRAAGYVAGGGSIVAGGGSAALFAAANFWNPAGWLVAGGAALLGVAWIAGWWGRRARGEAAALRSAARGDALAEAHEAVNRTFDELEEELLSRVTAAVRELLAKRLGPCLDEALALRTITDRLTERRRLIRTARDPLAGRAADPGDILRSAADACERDARMTGARRNHLWLGESWCDDPEGPDEEPKARARLAPLAAVLAPLRTRGVKRAVRSEFSRAAGTPASGSGPDWLTEVRQALEKDPEEAGLLTRLTDPAGTDRLTVAVCGDYSSGKSSLVKRLLLDAGAALADVPATGAKPTTPRPVPYDWQGMTLLDTPGFQAGRPDNTELTLHAVDRACAVLYVFPPGFGTGDSAELRRILDGPDRTSPGLAERALFVINKLDGFGPDPVDTPRDYAELIRRKRDELSRVLSGALGRPVPAARILPVASDPYQSAATSGTDFDPYRAWDGMDGLTEALLVLRDELGPSARDVAVLRRGHALLTKRVGEAEDQLDALKRQSVQLDRLLRDVTNQAEAGRELREERRTALHRIVNDLHNTLIAEADRTQAPDARAALAGRLETWWSQPELTGPLAAWHRDLDALTREWLTTTDELLERRLLSEAFHAAHPEPPEAIGLGYLRAGTKRESRAAAVNAAKGAGGALKSVGPEAVQDIAGALGKGLTPTDATLLAGRVARAGTVLGFVATAFDGYRLLAERRAEKRREAERGSQLEALRAQGRDWVGALCDGADGEPGALTALAHHCGELDTAVNRVRTRLSACRGHLESMKRRTETYRTLRAGAGHRLGAEGETA